MENNKKQKTKIRKSYSFSEEKSGLIFQEIIIYLFLCVIAWVCVDNIREYYQDYRVKQEYSRYQEQYPWLTWKIYEVTKQETDTQQVPTAWMLAIINSESRGKQYAVSAAGAIGLGQVMPFHYQGRKEALFDIDLNIHLSVKVFRACLVQHKFNLVRALNAYEGRNNRSDVNVHYLSEIFNNIYFYDKK
jgi:soluble lytic murein transglycosylase-like protein